MDEDLYLERESSKTVGIRLLRLKRLFVTETVFLRLLLADDSRREQLYVERALARHGPFGFNLASIERKDRDLSQLGETSFLPERLEWLLLSRERNTLDYQRSIEASGRLTNIAELWPYGLERLWLSHLIVDFRDLDFIADRLSGLETLMIRLPPTKYPVSRVFSDQSQVSTDVGALPTTASTDRKVSRQATQSPGVSSPDSARDALDVERHPVQYGRHAAHRSSGGTSSRSDRVLQSDLHGSA